MSIRLTGEITAAWSAPHVYFIRFEECLYVGETQRHPVIRWSQHLSPQGSFRVALEGESEIEFDSEKPIAFYAFELSRLRELFLPVQIRTATQAVEHEVHLLLRSRPSFLGIRIRIISDTEKTAPRAFRHWDIAQTLAEETTIALKAALCSPS